MARLARRSGAIEGEPCGYVRKAIQAITRLLEGEKVGLEFIECDFSRVDEFAARVYNAARTIPAGETASYGEVASLLGDARLARRVGQALGRNPFPIIVPCHRVVGSDGRLTGFSARGGTETKSRLLSIEGAVIGGTLDMFADHAGPRDS